MAFHPTPTSWLARSPEDLPAIAREILYLAGDCRVFAFEGQLGAGKTTLIKALCRELGVEELITSPTYALANQYMYIDHNGHHRLVHHLDLYRLNHLEEALSIGIEEYLSGQDYCFIEWPAVVAGLLPNGYAHLTIDVEPEATRKIVFLKSQSHSINT